MNKIRLILRWLFIPLWVVLFIVYLPIWYMQISWRRINFREYCSDAFPILWVKIMILMRLRPNE